MSTPAIQPTPLDTLFLQAPSFDGFDGGAGSRYQAKREIRSFWYPTWLAQPAAMVAGSRLLDAPADGLSVESTLEVARNYRLVIMHTSAPSFPTDARFAELLKLQNPKVLIGLVGAGARHGGSRGVAPGRERRRFRLWGGVRPHVSRGRRGLAPAGRNRPVLPCRRPDHEQHAACEINPHTIQVSLAAPYPGTALYQQAVANGWPPGEQNFNLVNHQGIRLAVISYPHLPKEEIFHSMELFYRRFYFRPSKICAIVKEMILNPEMIKRRLLEGVEFLRFLRSHAA